MHCTHAPPGRPLNDEKTEKYGAHPPNRGTDLALIRELDADKVIGDPTDAGDRYKNGLFNDLCSAYPAVKGSI
jgi:hypothetical protein